MGCFDLLIFTVVPIFMMVSLLRWFEQTTEAVDERDWSRVTLLVVFPFAVWWYPSRVSAGRPVPVPLHEPVRGFGKVPLAPSEKSVEGESVVTATRQFVTPQGADGPPPGTPKEFLGMPVIPPKKPGAKKPSVDPDKIAKLRQKMIEQGMLKPEEDKD
jgi:hypothetical protein